jgi:hypothetical protein
MNEHDYPPNPPPSWPRTLLKVLLYLVAGTAVLAVLAFGTCMLMLVRW